MPEQKKQPIQKKKKHKIEKIFLYKSGTFKGFRFFYASRNQQGFYQRCKPVVPAIFRQAIPGTAASGKQVSTFPHSLIYSFNLLFFAKLLEYTHGKYPTTKRCIIIG
jgi:hypothetical protein